jgi:signal transduction histidine kinase
VKNANVVNGAPVPDGDGELDRLALAGMAHDLANILCILRGWLEIGRNAADETQRQEALAQCRACVPRVRSLLERLETGSTKAEAALCVAPNTGAVIQETLELYAAMLPQGVQLLHPSWPPDPWPVTLRASDLERVLTNLVKNAAEAMPERGGRILVMASNVELWAGDNIPPGRYVLVTVQDTGTGMSKEQLERLFQPYATGKSGGTGLGLATVHQMVTQSGGQIWCESIPGKGTRFSLWLPIPSAA